MAVLQCSRFLSAQSTCRKSAPFFDLVGHFPPGSPHAPCISPRCARGLLKMLPQVCAARPPVWLLAATAPPVYFDCLAPSRRRRRRWRHNVCTVFGGVSGPRCLLHLHCPTAATAAQDLNGPDSTDQSSFGYPNQLLQDILRATCNKCSGATLLYGWAVRSFVRSFEGSERTRIMTKSGELIDR